MGVIGALCLFGGLGLLVMGLIGIVLGVFTGQWENVAFSVGIFGAGIISGTIGTAILE